jgi:hypothetical protein
MAQYVIANADGFGLNKVQTSFANLVAVGIAAALMLLPRIQNDGLDHVRDVLDNDKRILQARQEREQLRNPPNPVPWKGIEE